MAIQCVGVPKMRRCVPAASIFCLLGLLITGTPVLAGPPSPQSQPPQQGNPLKSVARSASEKPAEGDGTEQEPTVKLNFFAASWQTVFEHLAKETGSQLIMDRVPVGRLTRRDGALHNREQAVRILNREIEPLGFRLIEKGPFLIVLDLPSQRPRYQPVVVAKPPAEGDIATSDPVATPSPYQRRVQPVATRQRPMANPPLRAGAPEQGSGIELAGHAEFAATAGVAQAGGDTAAYAESTPSAVPGGPAATALTRPTLAVFRVRHRDVTELSRRVYQLFKADAQLVDSGRNGLPAFRVSPRSTDKVNRAYTITLDQQRGELLIEAPAPQAQSLLTLFGELDAPAEAGPIQLVRCPPGLCQLAADLPAHWLALQQKNTAPRETSFIEQTSGEEDGSNATFAAAALDDTGFADTATDSPQTDDATNSQDSSTATSTTPNNIGNDSPAGSLSSVLGNLKGEVKIESVQDLGVLILRGNERDVDQVLAVVRELEKLSEMTAPRVELKYLQNVEAVSLAELLTDVYERLTQFPGRATQPRQSVAVIPVDKPNAVLIIAPEADLAAISELADELDQPVDPETEFQIFRLKSASSTQVQLLLDQFYAERTGLSARVLVLADARTNSVLVRARPRDLDEVTALVRKLDLDDSAATSELKIFPLKNAVAAELAAVMNAAIQSVLSPPTNSTTGGGGAVQGLGAGQIDEKFQDAKSTVLQFLAVDANGEKKLRSGVLTDIRITPDARVNSLVVSAPEQSLTLIAELIRQLDQPSNAVAEIKVFTLANADAQQMVEQLQALFNAASSGGGGGGLNSQQRQQLGVLVAGAEDASSSLIPLRFSVDRRTNSIIAIGGADALRVVEAIMFRLDESDLRERKNTVYRLKNSPAANIAQSVNEFLTSQRNLNQAQPNLQSGVEQLEQEVIVVAEPVSNSLLISATPRYFEEITKLVAKLDEAPPQVIIQALIVEVELSNNDEFGVELGFQDSVLFDRSVVNNLVTLTETVTSPNGVQTTSQRVVSQEASPGFNFANPNLSLGNNTAVSPPTVGSQGLSSFSLGRVNGDLGFGGLVLSAGSESVSVLIRALAASRRIQVLSRPQIRTLDNQLAQILVGQVVPVVDGVNITGNGIANPIVRQAEAGIILTVTPRISPDGQIVMELVAEKSAYRSGGVPIFTDTNNGNVVESPIKDISTARSSISVPNNQTVVLGGMITSSEDSIERKVPFLGDIPLLGLAFRYDALSTRRTELLIFLTPRIIREDLDSEWIKEVEIGRMHFIEEEAERMHGPLRSVPGEISGEVLGEPFMLPEGFAPQPIPADSLPGTTSPLTPIQSPVPNLLYDAQGTELPPVPPAPGLPDDLQPLDPSAESRSEESSRRVKVLVGDQAELASRGVPVRARTQPAVARTRPGQSRSVAQSRTGAPAPAGRVSLASFEQSAPDRAPGTSPGRASGVGRAVVTPAVPVSSAQSAEHGSMAATETLAQRRVTASRAIRSSTTAEQE